jgi:predicted nucleic acid-binding protein
MVASLIVRAEVVDLRIDRPQPDDVFMVDTNAWYWIAYSRFSQPAFSHDNRPKNYNSQTKHYPAYIKQAIAAKAPLHYCGLTLSELAHNIEKFEKDIFSSSGNNLTLKEYRHNYPLARDKVAEEVEASWATVTAIGTLASIAIDQSTIDAALTGFKSQCLDGYDLFLLQAMKAHNIKKVITDDCDFVTVPGIVVFTANKNAIESAKKQGKFVQR